MEKSVLLATEDEYFYDLLYDFSIHFTTAEKEAKHFSLVIIRKLDRLYLPLRTLVVVVVVSADVVAVSILILDSRTRDK